ncbi:MAG: flagellar biosynthesis regulator FlaF [Alphaproteobacteria bacterium]
MNNLNHFKSVQEDASVFLDRALALKYVANSNDDMKKIMILDSNLKLWVEIETTLQNSENILPEETKANLNKLSKFVEATTLSKGVNMTKKDFDCLANINMQISEGLLDAIKNYMAKEEAFSLLKCAVDIANAKDSNDEKKLITALDNNLKLWVYIKTLASSKESKLPEDVKENLIKLSDYVSIKTIKIGNNLNESNLNSLDSLISTNLQISEGLISTQAA